MELRDFEVDFTSDKLGVKSLDKLGRWAEEFIDKLTVRGISVTEKVVGPSTEEQKTIAEAKVALWEARVHSKRDEIGDKPTADRNKQRRIS